MAKTDVKLYATGPDAKTTTTTISDVNPDATSSQLVQMGHLFNNLTQNTYGKTDRINTINCDTESGDSKLTPTFTLNKTTDTKANVCAGQNGFVCYQISYTYDGDGEIFVHVTDNAANLCVAHWKEGSKLNIGSIASPAQTATSITSDAVITFRTTETDTYKAAEATFTVTA